MTEETTSRGKPRQAKRGPGQHDAGYKLMFSDPRMVQELLHGIFGDLAVRGETPRKHRERRGARLARSDERE